MIIKRGYIMKIRVFTDGSSLISKDRTHYESSSAVIIYVDGKAWFEFGKYHSGGTNSLGEVYAMKLAFDKLYEKFTPEELTDVEIICDSEYVVKSCTKWIYNWVKKDWIGSKGDEVKFVEIFKELYEKYLCKKIRNRNIKIYHIKSHKNTDSIKKLLKLRLDFQARNEVELSQEKFNWFLNCNDEVDRLANTIRYNRLENYENDIGRVNYKWETKNGRIVLRRKQK